MKITTNLIHAVFALSALLLMSTCSKPERDNPWDENSTLNPEDWAPKDFQVEKVTITSNRLTWTYEGDNRFEGFRVDRKKGGEAWQEAFAKLPKESRSWVDENVEPDSTLTYTYRLYAFAGNQLSKEENIASAAAIAAPTNLIITQNAISSVTLTWEDKSAGEEGFRIERKQGIEAWVEIGTTTEPTYSDFSFAVNTDVYYRVCAYYEGFQSSAAMSLFNSQIPAPTALRLEMKSLISVTLTWQYTMPGIEGFIVERKQGDGNWQQFSQLSANELMYVDHEVDPLNHDYFYRVFARYRNYTSLASPIVDFGSRITENALGVNLVLKRIEGGTFEMGSADNSNSQPTHTVSLNTFYIGMFEITQAQWYAVMGTSPSYFTNCNDCPVEQVSWNDAQEFLQKLNQASGRNYTLPTEAQWEYAAGGGATNRTIWAGTNSESSLGSYAWYGSNSNSQTHTVGTKSPNTLILYDMTGNVWEWCEDDLHDNYQGAPADGRAWIDSPRGSYRVFRGGSWGNIPADCRVAFRGSGSPDRRGSYLGFRVALVP